MDHFDPDAAAIGEGIYGLPTTREQARVVILPVPFDATTSYRSGTADGPAAILEASKQVDLEDLHFGAVWKSGLFMEEISEDIESLSREARRHAAPLIEKGGADPNDPDDRAALQRVNAASERMNEHVYARAREVLSEGRIPCVLGGEHAVSFGAIRACAEAHGEIGVLQIDAHMDFRESYEGFTWSHASIMHNVMTRVPAVKRIVQVGIRDFGSREREFADSLGKRCKIYDDRKLARTRVSGGALAKAVADKLPSKVYLSFDIDGLDPALCPHTGTPVPGGPDFRFICDFLETLAQTGLGIVGFDLVEVAPDPTGETDWDANVAARLLYKLCGLASTPREE